MTFGLFQDLYLKKHTADCGSVTEPQKHLSQPRRRGQGLCRLSSLTLLQQFGRESISRPGWTGHRGILCCMGSKLSQIAPTQLSRAWSLFAVSSHSACHLCLQPWKKVKLEPRREKNANRRILGDGWGRIQISHQSSMSPKIAQDLTEIFLILKINRR